MLARLENMSRKQIEDEFDTSGKRGKEGVTYIAKDKQTGNTYAIKLFSEKKAASKIRTETELQEKAAKAGVAPKVHFYSADQKFIIMDALKETIVEKAKREGWTSLPNDYEAMLYALCLRLDKAGVVQNDGNPLNLMLDENGRLYIIDYGFAKKVTEKVIKKRGPQPNVNLTLWHFSSQLVHYRLKNDLTKIVKKYLGSPGKTNYDYVDEDLKHKGERLLATKTASESSNKSVKVNKTVKQSTTNSNHHHHHLKSVVLAVEAAQTLKKNLKKDSPKKPQKKKRPKATTPIRKRKQTKKERLPKTVVLKQNGPAFRQYVRPTTPKNAKSMTLEERINARRKKGFNLT